MLVHGRVDGDDEDKSFWIHLLTIIFRHVNIG